MEIVLPELILLEDFEGDYTKFIEFIYSVFQSDFIKHKTGFRGEELRLKWHPVYLDKAYTFYHMTHKGEDEQNRIPDLRRCERLPWAKPVIENCDKWNLKIWPQNRKGASRLCIWLELKGEPDYFVILDIRKNYKLLWTAFVAEYEHEKRKKQKEFEEWLKTQKPPES
ncbi:MAG: hypothetical protein HY840_07005 [Bacteroidetes bacterium]|nr:hypothetical protein [Bacteroidota bacterium]